MNQIVEESAGGVLICPRDSENLACLIKVETRGGNPTWRLPKGTIVDGETPKEAGIRETYEETGCRGEVLNEVSDIEYWYTRRDDETRNEIRVRKHVRFFVMRYLEGDVSDHDDEVETAKWFPFSEAIRSISYDAEREVLQEAIYAWEAHVYRQGFSADQGSGDREVSGGT